MSTESEERYSAWKAISENWALTIKCFHVEEVILAHTSQARANFLDLPHFKRAGKYDLFCGLKQQRMVLMSATISLGGDHKNTSSF